MKQITIRYPDSMSEREAVERAENVFNPLRHDYKAKTEKGKKNATVLPFADGMHGKFWLDVVGYVLEISD